ncbi:MAG: hypothetical protein KatS3mg023_3881 [Armatimonadota bacterium]|nr:MAG: hypothetical protein KatS3mg023_3881 [Armatimonadota bacterium]
MNPTFNDVAALIRRFGHQLVDLLREVKFVHKALDGRVTSLDLLRTRITVPEGCTLDADGKVWDGEGNLVADYSDLKYECDLVMSALAGLRAAVALLENDSEFLQRPGVVGTSHWQFVEHFLDWHKRGGF